MKRQTFLRGTAAALLLLPGLAARPACAQQDTPQGTPVIAPDALTTPEQNALIGAGAAIVVPVVGQPFAQAVRVTITQPTPETNAVQVTLPNAAPVAKGDALIASFYVRGTRPAPTQGAKSAEPTRMAFLFERATSPWTKSATRSVAAQADGKTWRKVSLAFTSAEDYAPGEAMASLRLAFGPQTIEVGGLSVVNLGKSKTEAELLALSAQMNPLGRANVTINPRDLRQTIDGFGGNYAQPRYGSTEPLDAVGRYSLDHLNVRCARVGVPLNFWNPSPGEFRDDGQARACFLAMQEMTRRKIPVIATVWEPPRYLTGGKPEESGTVLARDKYPTMIEAVVRFLTTARDKYKAEAEYFSFNEADYGINVRFVPQDIAEFIRQAGPRFKQAGLKTRFLVGDTANGNALVGYATPLLEDAALAPYLGPIAFHCWDVLDAPDTQYTAIADLGHKYKKPIWCTEAGFDAQLWQKPNPWDGWDSGLRLALAYARTLTLSGPSRMYYWTYQDNYPLVSQDAQKEYPTFAVVRQFERLFPRGTRIARLTCDREELSGVAGVRSGKVSALLVNSAGAGQVTVSGLGSKSLLRVTVMSDGRTASAPEMMIASAKGTLTIAAPARSVIIVAPR